MAYGALFAAMLTGDALHGALLMAGFGLGTLPALLGLVVALRGWLRTAGGSGKRAAGLLVTAFAVVTLMLAAPGGPLCLTP